MVIPIEIMHWEVLPSIRSNLVLSLKKKGLKQTEISQLFEMTPSAISQYLKEKRGKYLLPEEFQKNIEESSNLIFNKKSTVFIETNLLLKQFEKKYLCKLCKEKNSINYKCGICFDN